MSYLSEIREMKNMIRVIILIVPWMWISFFYYLYTHIFFDKKQGTVLEWCIMIPLMAICFAVLVISDYRQYKQIKQEKLERIASTLLGECDYYPKYAFRPINITSYGGGGGGGGSGLSGNIVSQQTGYSQQSVTGLGNIGIDI